ncbi:MAG: efflux RND transporter permease subunit, partial [Lentisphaeria bacterium]|nr:efflux RND transporter permease subunit [Lentisphaeria bacterium]
LPVSVLLSVPIAFAGAVGSLWLLGIENNIYTQVGFVLLFGIACKTAILIVEFAKEQHDGGKDVYEAAEYAAKLRFRSVLMTAVTFVLGTYPLVIASGACSVSRRSLGTTVFGGMLVSVVIGTILIPVFFVFIQLIVNKCCKRKNS